VRFGVLRFPGSCDEIDALLACRRYWFRENQSAQWACPSSPGFASNWRVQYPVEMRIVPVVTRGTIGTSNLTSTADNIYSTHDDVQMVGTAVGNVTYQFTFTANARM